VQVTAKAIVTLTGGIASGNGASASSASDTNDASSASAMDASISVLASTSASWSVAENKKVQLAEYTRMPNSIVAITGTLVETSDEVITFKA
jgi:hypothetical protein